MRYDATHEYQSVTVQDGCESLLDVTTGRVAHGVDAEYFRRWQAGETEHVESNDNERISEYGATLHTPDAPADVTGAPRDYEAELAALWARLGAEANTRGWCDEYDAFAAEMNGPARPPRQWDYTMTFGLALDIRMNETDRPRDAFNASGTPRERRELQRTAVKARLARAAYWGEELTDAQLDAATSALLDYMGRDAGAIRAGDDAYQSQF